MPTESWDAITFRNLRVDVLGGNGQHPLQSCRSKTKARPKLSSNIPVHEPNIVSSDINLSPSLHPADFMASAACRPERRSGPKVPGVGAVWPRFDTKRRAQFTSSTARRRSHQTCLKAPHPATPYPSPLGSHTRSTSSESSSVRITLPCLLHHHEEPPARDSLATHHQLSSWRAGAHLGHLPRPSAWLRRHPANRSQHLAPLGQIRQSPCRTLPGRNFDPRLGN